MLLFPILLLLLGFVLLWKGSDWLIDAAVNIATAFAIPAYIIGFTILAFGTSLPELIVNVLASLKGQDELVLGNILGSNLSNLLLILSLTGLITACHFSFNSFSQKIKDTLIAHLIFGILLVATFYWQGQLEFSWLQGLFFLGYFTYMLINQKQTPTDTKTAAKRVAIKDVAWLILGFCALFLGGKWVVDSASSLALALGFSQAFVALFLVALGTSLPELATSLAGIRKGQKELVLGNIIGSNIFNLAFILPVSACIHAIQVPRFLIFDIVFLVLAHALFFVFWPLNKMQNKRFFWLCLLLCYCVYIGWITLRG